MNESKREAKAPNGGYRFSMEIDGQRIEFASPLSHVSAANQAITILDLAPEVVPDDIKTVIRKYRDGLALVYREWGVMHYLVFIQSVVLNDESSKSPDKEGLALTDQEIAQMVNRKRLGEAPRPKESRGFEAREDPGFGGTREQWKKNRKRYDG